MGDLPERSRQYAGAIRIAARAADDHSIDDVLDMAQIDAGEMELTLGDVRIKRSVSPIRRSRHQFGPGSRGAARP